MDEKTLKQWKKFSQISSFMFHREKKVIQVWNNTWAGKLFELSRPSVRSNEQIVSVQSSVLSSVSLSANENKLTTALKPMKWSSLQLPTYGRILPSKNSGILRESVKTNKFSSVPSDLRNKWHRVTITVYLVTCFLTVEFAMVKLKEAASSSQENMKKQLEEHTTSFGIICWKFIMKNCFLP